MSWINIAISPIGPLYFGDGRPVSAGETDHGEGRFPPSPRTMQGIVRTALLRSVPNLDLGSGADRARIAALVGPPESLPDGWQIAGPWLAQWRAERDGAVTDVSPWLPLPIYFVGQPHSETLGVVEPIPCPPGRMRWDIDKIETAPRADHRSRISAFYVGPKGLRVVLTGGIPSMEQVHPEFPKFVARETRIGLRVEPEREVAEEGMLYTLGYRRFADNSGLVVRFQGALKDGLEADSLTHGMTSIGGRTRVARLLSVSSWSAEFAAALRHNHLPSEPSDGERFWLWTTTPVPLDQPWAPEFAIPSIGGARLEVVTAVIGRSEAIGGFALSEDRSQASVRHTPAGSAWLVAVCGGEPDERGMLLRSLHDAFPFRSDPAAPSAMGFGHTLVSRLPHLRS